MTVYLWGNTDIQKAHFVGKEILARFIKKKRNTIPPNF